MSDGILNNPITVTSRINATRKLKHAHTKGVISLR